MIFETSRLYVRRLNEGDLEGFHNLYSDPAIMEFIRPALTMEETKQIFEEQLLQYHIEPQLGRYMIIDKISGSFIGIFMLRKPETLDGIEIGYSFRKQDWGKGYATEIVKKGIEYIFSSTRCTALYAYTHLKNKNSKNVLTKCGFTYERDLYEEGNKSNLFSLAKELV